MTPPKSLTEYSDGRPHPPHSTHLSSGPQHLQYTCCLNHFQKWRTQTPDGPQFLKTKRQKSNQLQSNNSLKTNNQLKSRNLWADIHPLLTLSNQHSNKAVNWINFVSKKGKISFQIGFVGIPDIPEKPIFIRIIFTNSFTCCLV